MNFDNIMSFLFVVPTTFETSTVYVNDRIVAKSFLINGQTVAAVAQWQLRQQVQ